MQIINYINQITLCKKMHEKGEYEEGITVALDAISAFPEKSHEILYLLGLNYFGLSSVLYKSGRRSKALKELSNAEKAFRKALRNSPKVKEVEVYYYMGLIYERQEKGKKAMKYYRKALSKEPDFPAAVERLNHCLAI